MHFVSTATGSSAVQLTRGINPNESLDIVFRIANVGVQQPFDAVVADLFHQGLTVQLTGSGFQAGSNAT